jgi:hypothetical protein
MLCFSLEDVPLARQEQILEYTTFPNVTLNNDLLIYIIKIS